MELNNAQSLNNQISNEYKLQLAQLKNDNYRLVKIDLCFITHFYWYKQFFFYYLRIRN